MRKTEKAWLLTAALGTAALAAFACSEKITVRGYVLHSEKIKTPVRLLHVSDLHSAAYGKDGKLLPSLTEKLHPDAVLMTGDIVDNRISSEHALRYAHFVGSHYPTYYVSGNHEVYTCVLPAIKDKLRSCGITVLEGGKAALSVREQTLAIHGIDDPYAFPDPKGRLWEDQLADTAKAIDPATYSILLTHRPEIVDYYAESDFDLILSGHAHGGQIILPGLLNGLYAPHQGAFPKYAGGRYELKENQTMIVSRGLSRYVRPRIFNRPELVLITLLPKETE